MSFASRDWFISSFLICMSFSLLFLPYCTDKNFQSYAEKSSESRRDHCPATNCRGSPADLSGGCAAGMLHGRHTTEHHGRVWTPLAQAAHQPALQDCLVSRAPSHGPLLQHGLLFHWSTSLQAGPEFTLLAGSCQVVIVVMAM